MSKARLGSSRSLPLLIVLTLTLVAALSMPTPVSAATLRVRPSGGPGYFTTIQAAINVAVPNDVIHVYPGTYGGVVLNTMATQGNISIIAVDSSGNATPGTATVNGGAASAFNSAGMHPGDVTIDGFVVTSTGLHGVNVQANGDVVIRNVTANGVSGIGLYLGSSPSGDITIEGCSTDSTGFHGILGSGDVVIRNTTANGTGGTGITATTLGDVTVRNCTANNNKGQAQGHGILVGPTNGKVIVANCTADNNLGTGITVGATGTEHVTGCITRGNGVHGVSAYSPVGVAGGTLPVNGNIICGNSIYGLSAPPFGSADAEGNWWGCSGGPGSPGCDTIGGGVITPVDFTPWISTYTADATPGSGVAGQPVQISFQFSDSASTVFLPQGPGDLNGSPTFTLHTDNGTLTDSDETGATVHEFIGSGNVLSVTLVPDSAGTATVTADGPCELAATITIGVSEAEEEFVPEPGTIMLLGSGLLGLAGYASLRWRSRD